MIDPAFKTQWIEALRSGLYPQYRGGISCGGRATERNPKTSYCCIGVAGIVLGMNRLSPDWSTGCVGEKIGLTLIQRAELVERNDLYGESFDEIADYIEENL